MKVARRISAPGRKEQRLEPRREDSYRDTSRHREPVCCPRCTAFYVEGRWTWREAPGGTPPLTCPACLRIEHDHPAGYVEITGAFVADHRAEIVALVDARSRRARDEHPLQRLMGLVETPLGLRLTTTDGHLAQTVATALSDAFKGELDIHFSPDHVVRATWRREA